MSTLEIIQEDTFVEIRYEGVNATLLAETITRLDELEDLVEAGGKVIEFNDSGFARVKDDGLAQEIRDRYGKRVTVTKMRYEGAADHGHRYFFGSMPEMPWKRRRDENQSVDTQDTGGEK